MNSHLAAIKTRLAPLGYLTHLYSAPTVTAQYLVISGPAWDTDPEPGNTASDSFATGLLITAVTGTPEGVPIMLSRVRNQLSPGPAATHLEVPGRSAWISWTRSEFVQIDRDELIEGTNLHPAFGVDTYTLTSEPA